MLGDPNHEITGPTWVHWRKKVLEHLLLNICTVEGHSETLHCQVVEYGTDLQFSRIMSSSKNVVYSKYYIGESNPTQCYKPTTRKSRGSLFNYLQLNRNATTLAI
jgi:hypothetical protein